MLGKCKIVFGHELNHGGINVRSYGVVNTGACLQIRLLTFIPSCLHIAIVLKVIKFIARNL